MFLKKNFEPKVFSTSKNLDHICFHFEQIWDQKRTVFYLKKGPDFVNVVLAVFFLSEGLIISKLLMAILSYSSFVIVKKSLIVARIVWV